MALRFVRFGVWLWLWSIIFSKMIDLSSVRFGLIVGDFLGKDMGNPPYLLGREGLLTTNSLAKTFVK